MLRFIFKGVLRDKSRSLLPVIVVALGVFLTVFMSGWISGIFGDMIRMNANFSTGHVRIMTRAYAENKDQIPNDLALLQSDSISHALHQLYPNMQWAQRIHFGAIMDVPDSLGETRAQGQAIGRAIDFLSGDRTEIERMNIPASLVQGRIPNQLGEALISNDFSERFDVKMGDDITIFGSTMYGGMLFKSFKVCGTVKFGTVVLDRGAILIDLEDAQMALDMQDATSEILGYYSNGLYDDARADSLCTAFNATYSDENDEYSPQMFRLAEDSIMGQYIPMAEAMSGVLVTIFILVMSVVLWNTGLLGGLRRYNEFGVRLALGEEKSHIFKTTIYEAVLVGIMGSIVGTILGLSAVYYLQEVGLDFSDLTQNVTMLLPPVYRAKITPELFYIGFIPGLLATTLGNALAGYAIYKRKTARLFKELEV